ncbi:two-component system response regulator [Chitinimonas arctica]|uniref:Two-component system response regulator n=1 Tax=Chitinimonas arctica TaxID=2594795 RepID=A0A516SLC3_9NEIS|nr:two-component system response regulator [Chitinimonas arctica]QDQ28945.1 two-component system response regulator [Chitinimonas arctica]
MPTDTVIAIRPTILVVDDVPQNLSLIGELLMDNYVVKVAHCGEKALRIAHNQPCPDLILLDVMMPEMDGYEVCRQLKADPRTCDIPVIFLTAMSAEADEQHGFDLGATDYIAKPVSPPILRARVQAQLRLKAASDFLRDNNAFLEQEVNRRTEEVHAVQEVAILAVASLAETRDNETGNHILRTQHYVKLLAEYLARQPRFADVLTEAEIELLFKSAPLHDIGKVGIPDRILLKPGKLTPEEFEIMKTHPALGRDAIVRAEERLGKRVPFLRLAKEIAYSHQEKWDGSGYPDGLVGEAIPLSARLMAVADVYDALISRRVYKASMPHAQAVGIILAGSGSHFDPVLVEAFALLVDQFHAIAMRFTDSESDLHAEKERLGWIAEEVVQHPQGAGND